MAKSHRLTLAPLLVVGFVSLFLISGIDAALYRLLSHTAPGWKVVPDLRITSLLTCGILCFAYGRGSLNFPLPQTPWRTVLIASAMWLFGTILALFVFHVWTPLLPSWIDLVSFLVTGLLAEELLFRGAVFSLAEKVSGATDHPPIAAIGLSAVLFGLQHFGYHGWNFSQSAWTQVAYTTAFGVLLGLLRSWSGTLWIPAAIHFVNNLASVVYRRLDG